jgi:hypothetical protein
MRLSTVRKIAVHIDSDIIITVHVIIKRLIFVLIVISNGAPMKKTIIIVINHSVGGAGLKNIEIRKAAFAKVTVSDCFTM